MMLLIILTALAICTAHAFFADGCRHRHNPFLNAGVFHLNTFASGVLVLMLILSTLARKSHADV